MGQVMATSKPSLATDVAPPDAADLYYYIGAQGKVQYLVTYEKGREIFWTGRRSMADCFSWALRNRLIDGRFGLWMVCVAAGLPCSPPGLVVPPTGLAVNVAEAVPDTRGATVSSSTLHHRPGRRRLRRRGERSCLACRGPECKGTARTREDTVDLRLRDQMR